MFQLTRLLHRLGIHAACREVREYMNEWPAMRLDDGTLWRPDINGLPMIRRRYHVPRLARGRTG
jgi:hypothetical protein